MSAGRTTPPVFDVTGDAERAFEVLRSGGVAVVPNTIGYSALGASPDALDLIFRTKGRAPQKLNAMVGDMQTHRSLHVCSERGRRIVETIVYDYGLPLGCIAPYSTDHPLMTALPPEVVAASTRADTLVMLLNAGDFHAELTRIARENGVALFGSSANLTLGGTKFRVEDIEQEILDIAGIVVDHGLQKYHPYGSSSTLINVETLEIVRRGSCFDDIAYVLQRHFGEDITR